MAIDLVRRMWTSLLVICIPTSLGALAWVLFMGGRPAAAELAGAYLLIVIAGRAHAADQARRAKPARLARVRTQVDRVKSTLPGQEVKAPAETGHLLDPGLVSARLARNASATLAAGHQAGN